MKKWNGEMGKTTTELIAVYLIEGGVDAGSPNFGRPVLDGIDAYRPFSKALAEIYKISC